MGIRLMVDHVTLTHAVGVRLSHPQLLCGDGRTSNLKCVSRTDTDAFRNLRSLKDGTPGYA